MCSDTSAVEAVLLVGQHRVLRSHIRLCSLLRAFSRQVLQSQSATEMGRSHLSLLTSAVLLSSAFGLDSDCDGKRVYVQEVPAKFNEDLAFRREDDSKLKDWFSPHMMLHLELLSANNGFGPAIQGMTDDPELQGLWYKTDQHAMEVIFHFRMKSHKCRVYDHLDADMVYIPYYGAHDALRNMHRDIQTRDSLAVQLLEWLQRHPAWHRRQGADHFWILGKDVWDFHRQGADGWGSQLLTLPSSRERVWTVCAETNPGMKMIMSAPRPIPFHPQSRSQLERWQQLVQSHERKWLFAFVGARRRRESEAGAARESLFWQCENSNQCQHVDCTVPNMSRSYPCENMQKFLPLYMTSTFCLHPVGDSCSRRSVLDGIMAGCIPVVFRSCSLQDQLWWHLHSEGPFYITIPANSVRAPWDEPGTVDKVLVEDVLSRISRAEVAAMRKRIINIIPRIVYGGRPEKDGFVGPDFKDAVDIMIDGLASSMRRNSTWHRPSATSRQGHPYSQ